MTALMLYRKLNHARLWFYYYKPCSDLSSDVLSKYKLRGRKIEA